MKTPAMPCLIHEGPPRLSIWPMVTMEVRGEQLTVDALARIGAQDPQWFILEIGEKGAVTPASRMRELALDMPCVRLTDQDILHPDFMANLLQRIQAVLPRQAA
ncbi:MAG: hypothetical protein AMXMBFR33_34350 [Candidatus Xenobia bacterium]